MTVSGVDDNLIDGTITSTITLSVVDGSSDNNFDPVADQTVSATTTDNDVAGFTIVQSGGSTSVAETGTTDTFTVVLNAQPASNVVLTITSGDTGEATVTGTLTFTSGNWNSAQTVTVTGVDDNLVDGSQTSTITVAVNDGSSDNNFDPVADQTVSATTTDNDVAGFTIVQSGGSTSVAETGTTDTFTVVLNAQPASNVVLSISSADTGEATVTSSLTFTNGNWNSAQTVTVTGVDDNIIDGTQTTTITAAVIDAISDDAFDSVANQTVSATTTDNDVAGFTIAQSDGSTSVNESGNTDTFTLVLNAQPSSDVVLSISSADTGEATVTSLISFTSGNWNTPQTVTVTGVNDSIIDGTITTTMTVIVVDAISNDNFDGVADQTVSVTTVDNDVAGFTIVQSGGSTSVNESGTTDTFTVVLNAQPSSDVVLQFVSSDTGEATVTSLLTFTSGNWNSAQTVTVTGVNEEFVDLNQTSTITASIVDVSSDDNFDGVADQTVSVTTVDNDVAGFTIVQSGGSTSVNESGTTDTFTIVLTGRPTSDVVLNVTSSDTGEATVTNSLTFTAANWNSAQTVTVTGVNDNIIDGTITSTLTVAVNDGSSDNDFDGVADQTVSATTVDNDVAGFTIVQSSGSTSVNESGTTDTFTIVLNAQPASDVVLNITSSDTGEATVNSPLTFTAANWNSAQTVTVTGVNDNIIDGTITS
ncbi:MAG: beta strand repeat-containing protein, partial [Acidimicrobiales bacterium]